MVNVLLVHGMARSPLSLRPLAASARLEGGRVHSFGYVATFESAEHIAARLASRLAGVTASGPTVAVGHSLGGVLLRMAVARLPDGARPPDRLILIASPHRPSRIARKLRRFLPFRLLNGDAGQMLGDPDRMAAVPLPGDVPCTIVLGTGGSQGHWTPFAGEPNDGLVAADEALLHCGEEVVTTPALHSFVMHHASVRRLLRDAVKQVASSRPLLMAAVLGMAGIATGCGQTNAQWFRRPAPVAALPSQLVPDTARRAPAAFPGTACISPLLDEAGRVRFTLYRSTLLDHGPVGDYEVDPPGSYALGRDAVVRVDCAIGRPLGSVPR